MTFLLFLFMLISSATYLTICVILLASLPYYTEVGKQQKKESGRGGFCMPAGEGRL